MLKTLPAGALAWPRSAAVIGAGTMGLGVTESWIAAGVPVALVDATPERTQAAQAQLVERVRRHVAAGLVDQEVLARVERAPAAADIAGAAANADLVFEAVFERVDVKQAVLAAIEDAARPDAVIATNTSSLPIDGLAAWLRQPERFLGVHWFNPPEWTPGVEIIPAQATERGVVDQVQTFLLAIGKRPIVVGSGPGFVANRIQMALFREAVACVEDGLATPEQVDQVVRACFGFRLPFFGPFQIADMAGLDVYQHVFGTLERGLGERFRSPPTLDALVDQGRFGTKTEAGFFDYTPEQRDGLLIERDRRYAALSALLEQLAF